MNQLLYLSEIRQLIEDVAGFEADTKAQFVALYKGYTGRGRLYKMSLHRVNLITEVMIALTTRAFV